VCGRRRRAAGVPACAAAGAGRRFPRLRHPQCTRCGHPLVVGDLPRPHAPGPRRCRWCDLLPPYVRAVRSVCWAPEGSGGRRPCTRSSTTDDAGRRRHGTRDGRTPLAEDGLRERAALVPVPLGATRAAGARVQSERGCRSPPSRPAGESRRGKDVLPAHACYTLANAVDTGERQVNVAGAFAAVPARRLGCGARTSCWSTTS
jgi:hypothetical protein